MQTELGRFDYVERRKFCDLLTSRRKLLRCDDLGSRIRGLFDAENGRRYLIREEDLFPPATSEP